jgi:V8-like Glu-specific endopeptidase
MIAFDKFEKQVFLSTVLIENLTDGEMGTGFVVFKPVDEINKKFLLFSNKHVFWGKKDKDKMDVQKDVRLTFHKKGEGGVYEPGNVHQVVGKLTRSADVGYYDHPDSEVDVACANISKFGDENLRLHIAGVGEDFFEYDVDDLHAGMRVSFVGYPSGFFDKKNWLPVMRSGTISSIPSIPFNGKPQILLDAQVFPGSSGSPVFVSLKGKYKLIGLISDGINKGLDFAEVEKTGEEVKETVKIPKEWIGLGLLFTLEAMKEVYDLA